MSVSQAVAVWQTRRPSTEERLNVYRGKVSPPNSEHRVRHGSSQPDIITQKTYKASSVCEEPQREVFLQDAVAVRLPNTASGTPHTIKSSKGLVMGAGQHVTIVRATPFARSSRAVFLRARSACVLASAPETRTAFYSRVNTDRARCSISRTCAGSSPDARCVRASAICSER